ncbi:hypothetical protein H632_c5080p0, partial [Helicosporidium sp. ATCC 50920]
MGALRGELRRDAGSGLGYALRAGTAPLLLPPALAAFLGEVRLALRAVLDARGLSSQDKYRFLRELRHAHGRAALMLSGGGSFGFFHFGVVRALLALQLMPRVVSGSSAGAIGAAILASASPADRKALLEEFPGERSMDFMAHSSTGHMVRHLVAQGTTQDTEFFVAKIKALLGEEVTFADAYERSGLVLNVSVVPADTREPARI